VFDYKNILFPVDLSEDSAKIAPHVKTIASRFQAVVHLVYVAKTSEYYREDECDWKPVTCEAGQAITNTVVEFAKEHCSILAEPKIVVLDGEPGLELLSYIDHKTIDLVVMATSKKKTALGKALFGSVAGSIVRNSTVPVFFVRPEKDRFLR
jgi:nucleotide-binding universal stress UspA family protein